MGEGEYKFKSEKDILMETNLNRIFDEISDEDGKWFTKYLLKLCFWVFVTGIAFGYLLFA